jgi:hypothetical protein
MRSSAASAISATRFGSMGPPCATHKADPAPSSSEQSVVNHHHPARAPLAPWIEISIVDRVSDPGYFSRATLGQFSRAPRLILSPMSVQRPFWTGEGVYLGDVFRLTKGRSKFARAALSSHQFGWELKLLINDDVRQTQVCRSHEDIEATADRWKAAFYQEGWGVKGRRGDTEP